MIDHIKKIEQSFNLAIKYLSYKPRTVHEMQEYIEKKGFSEEIINKVIKILVEKNYLNDKNFAKLFLESKARYKPKSKFALKYELKKKGINSLIIDSALEKYDDQKLALKAIESKIRVWKKLDDEQFKKKMFNYLNYRGFNYDIFISTLNHFRKLKYS